MPKFEMTMAATTAPANTLTYDQARAQQRPSVSTTNLANIFTRCRTLAYASSFLKPYLKLKQDFYNYGFDIRIGPMGKGNDETLSEWLNKEITSTAEYTDPSTKETITIEVNLTNIEAITKLVADVWREYLLLDNAVTVWFDDPELQPTTIAPEFCEYSDKLGYPILKYQHGLSKQEIAMLPTDKQARFAKGQILLNAAEGEHFKVLKSGLTGAGFAVPGLYSAFELLAEVAQKDEGFHARSFALLNSPRHHKIGHAIESGLHAGKPNWFMNKKRADKTIELFKDRRGPFDLPTNFDHTIEYPWPDVEHFDETMWKGTNSRLMNWGGPAARMLLSENASAGLGVLRAQATEDRKAVRLYATQFIRKAFAAPEELDITLNWSDLIFNDAKQAAELLKSALQFGLVSCQTAREQIGYNDAVESKIKVKEADDAEAVKKYRPAWDVSHGIAPQAGETSANTAATGPDAGSTNGRPAGSENA